MFLVLVTGTVRKMTGNVRKMTGNVREKISYNKNMTDISEKLTAKYQKYDGNFENWLVMLEKQLVTSLSILTSKFNQLQYISVNINFQV